MSTKYPINHIKHLTSPKVGIVVNITPDEYVRCEESSFNMGCNNKKSNYGRGMLNTDEDPRKVERVGRLGEVAVAKILNLKVDWEYKRFGDKCDFSIDSKLKIDVKTIATRNYLPDKGFIRAADGNGKTVPIRSDIFIFCYLHSEDKINKIASVELYKKN